jgi:FkbM family methyltransferase
LIIFQHLRLQPRLSELLVSTALHEPLRIAEDMIENLIYDVGMSDGDDTAYYLARGFRVVAIEANPLLVEQASRRLEREIAIGDLLILNVGASDRDGSFPFWICDSNPDWSTFDVAAREEKGVDFRQVTVSCRRFRCILEEFGTPYYLKLDIEGNEIFCLRDLIASDLPEYVSFEKTTRAVECLTILHDLGYRRFKLISQRNYLAVEFPPSQEQRRSERAQSLLKSRNIFLRILRKAGARGWLQRQAAPARYKPDWTFSGNSSGPFGEDTPGKWQTFEEIVETLTKANSSFDAREPSAFWSDTNSSFWADFHVKKEV